MKSTRKVSQFFKKKKGKLCQLVPERASDTQEYDALTKQSMPIRFFNRQIRDSDHFCHDAFCMVGKSTYFSY